MSSNSSETVAMTQQRRNGLLIHQGSYLQRSICDHGHIRHLRPDDVLMHEGTEPMFIGVVLSGVLRLQKLLEDGTHRVLGFLFPGDLFGSPGCADRRAGVEAATDTRVACLDRRTFAALMNGDRELERAFFMAALNELDAVYELSFLLGIHKRDARMAAYLHCLIERGLGEISPSGRREIQLPVPRRDLAAYLAIASETVCRTLHALERAGAIHLIEANRIEVVDERKLRRIAGEPLPTRLSVLERCSADVRTR